MQEDHPLIRAADLLESESLEYCLIGGYAVAVYGEPRATYDVDFLVNAPRENLEKLCERSKSLGWSAELRRADISDPVGDVVRVYRPFACDFLQARSALETDCISRSVKLELFGRRVRVASPEYLMLLLLQLCRCQ